jgi:hypothetical protein
MSDFNQVCVWPATIVGPDKAEEFQDWVMDEFGVRAQYIEDIKTNPDHGVPGTGGRNDVLFYVHDDDVGKFAIPRLQYGIRWLEDVYGNSQGHLYPDRIRRLRIW